MALAVQGMTASLIPVLCRQGKQVPDGQLQLGQGAERAAGCSKHVLVNSGLYLLTGTGPPPSYLPLC